MNIYSNFGKFPLRAELIQIKQLMNSDYTNLFVLFQ